MGLEEREGSGSRSRSYRQGKHLLPPLTPSQAGYRPLQLAIKRRMERLPKRDINKLGLIDRELSRAPSERVHS